MNELPEIDFKSLKVENNRIPVDSYFTVAGNTTWFNPLSSWGRNIGTL